MFALYLPESELDKNDEFPREGTVTDLVSYHLIKAPSRIIETAVFFISLKFS